MTTDTKEKTQREIQEEFLTNFEGVVRSRLMHGIKQHEQNFLSADAKEGKKSYAKCMLEISLGKEAALVESIELAKGLKTKFSEEWTAARNKALALVAQEVENELQDRIKVFTRRDKFLGKLYSWFGLRTKNLKFEFVMQKSVRNIAHKEFGLAKKHVS